MADLVTMEQVREQLYIDEGADVTLVTGLVAAATRAVELHTGRTVADGDATFGNDAPVAAMAVLLLVRTWYDNPEAVAFTKAVRAGLLARGFTLKPFA